MKFKMVFMCMLFVFISFLSVSADEFESELGTAEEFAQWSQSDASAMSTLNFVRRVGIIGGSEKRMYFSLMQIDGYLVYCIEPNVYAGTGENYEVDWSTLSESKKKRLFQLTNVGYQNYGHDDDKWFIATQLAVWRALGYSQYYALSMDGSPMDLSWEISEIERMADHFASKASFSDQTLTLRLNETKTITDTNGVLERFNVTDKQGVKIVQNKNQLEITITDIDFTEHLSDAIGITTGGLVYGRADCQKVYMVHRSAPPVSYSLNLKLKKGDISISKLDEYGNSASGTQVFEIRRPDGKTMLNEIVVQNGSAVLSNALPDGTYVLKECETTYPYVLSEEELSFTVDSDRLTELIFVNELETVPLQIVKKDTETKNYLDGAEFVVQKTNSAGVWQDVIRMGTKEGKAQVNDFKYGEKIRVCEAVPPVGYDLAESNCQVIVLTPLQRMTVTVEFENDRLRIPVTVVKRDKETQELLSGAEFVLKKMNDLNEWEEIERKTAEQGIVSFEQLKYGDHIQVCEVKAPEGYELSEKNCKTSILKEETLFEFENERREMKLRILKQDEKTLELLNGAQFLIRVFDEKLNEWSEKGIYTTGRKKICLGEKNSDLVVEVYEDELLQHHLGEFETDSYGNVDITHLNLSGTVYLRDSSGNRWSSDVENEDGLIELDGKYGEKYQVCEVKAPKGYDLADTACTEIELKSEKDVVDLFLSNHLHEAEVFILKRDLHSGELLNDALISVENENEKTMYGLTGRFYLHLTDEDGLPVSEEFKVYKDPECTELLFEGKTNEQGEYISECEESVVTVKTESQTMLIKVVSGGFSIGKVEYGETLKVCEVIAPSGYRIQRECIEVQIETDEDAYSIYLDNERIPAYEEVPSMGIS